MFQERERGDVGVMPGGIVEDDLVHGTCETGSEGAQPSDVEYFHIGARRHTEKLELGTPDMVPA